MDYQKLVSQTKTVAVVDASLDTQKYAFRVTKKLKDNVYEVFPINLKGEEIYGLTTFKNVNDIPENIDLISVVTPPKVSIEILDQVAMLNVKAIWFQPGLFNEDLLQKAHSLDLQVISDACILVEIDKLLNTTNEE